MPYQKNIKRENATVRSVRAYFDTVAKYYSSFSKQLNLHAQILYSLHDESVNFKIQDVYERFLSIAEKKQVFRMLFGLGYLKDGVDHGNTVLIGATKWL